jgi:hypothetical protein
MFKVKAMISQTFQDLDMDKRHMRGSIVDQWLGYLPRKVIISNI